MSKTVSLFFSDGIFSRNPMGHVVDPLIIIECGDSVNASGEDGVFLHGSISFNEGDVSQAVHIPLLSGEAMREVGAFIPNLGVVKISGFGKCTFFCFMVSFKEVVECVARLFGTEKNYKIELNTQGDVSEQFGETLVVELTDHSVVGNSGSRGECDQ